MAKKHNAVWLLSGGAMQQIAAEKILNRGFTLIVTDGNPNCACRKQAHEFVALDTFDIAGNLRASEKLRRKYNIRAVLTVAADCHETVAYLARKLGVHGISPKISHTCRYKLELRKVLAKAGIREQPVFRKASTISEAQCALRNIGLPAVIKSSNNSASRGFLKIERMRDFNRSVFRRAIENGTTGYVIIEKLLMPTRTEIAEQSVETLWYEGKMYWLNWVDRLFRKDFSFFKNFKKQAKKLRVGWGVELAHINPAIHDYETKRRVEELIYKAGVALGMNQEKGGHILKADIMLTSDGPVILEMTPRLSGGWDSSRTTPLRGGDFVGGVISLALGEKLTLESWHKYFQYQDPNLFASVYAKVKMGAADCIGRKFFAGISYNRETSLLNAYQKQIKL